MRAAEVSNTGSGSVSTRCQSALTITASRGCGPSRHVGDATSWVVYATSTSTVLGFAPNTAT
jgi:hypothetical protein